MAPIRTTASVAMAASGDIGRNTPTRSPSRTPRRLSALASWFTSRASSRYVRLRLRPSSPSQMIAGCSPRPASRWRSTQLSAKLIRPPSNQRGHWRPREASRTRVYGRVNRRPRSRTTASQYQSGSATLRRCSSASVPIPRDLMKRAIREPSAYSRVGRQTISLVGVSVMNNLPPRQCTRWRATGPTAVSADGPVRLGSGLRKLDRARNDPGQVRDDAEEGDLHDAEVDRHDLVEGLEARRRKRHARRLAALGEQLVQELHVDEIDRDQKGEDADQQRQRLQPDAPLAAGEKHRAQADQKPDDHGHEAEAGSGEHREAPPGERSHGTAQNGAERRQRIVDGRDARGCAGRAVADLHLEDVGAGSAEGPIVHGDHVIRDQSRLASRASRCNGYRHESNLDFRPAAGQSSRCRPWGTARRVRRARTSVYSADSRCSATMSPRRRLRRSLVNEQQPTV